MRLTHFFIVLQAVLLASSAFACPDVGPFVDINCDQEFRVAITGDSIVKGIGDEANDNEGGYVLRLQQRFSDGTFYNIGIAGTTTQQLFRDFKKNLNKVGEGETKTKTERVDLVIIHAGVNDYWLRKPAGFTVRNLKRIVKFLRKKLGEINGYEPLVGVAKISETNRGFQQPFVNEVNELLVRQRSSKLPVYLNLDRINPERHISFDNIHPNSKGYKKLSKLAGRFIRKKARKLALARVVDTDVDGIYDDFEGNYGTDPGIADTDGDTLLDGEEVFTFGTDPLDPLSIP